ncbi:MAG: hypothetical protein AAFX76_09055, partial [Planctomycetota bacterium]
MKTNLALLAALALAPISLAESPIIPPDAELEVVSVGDYRFVEGPALAPDGSVIHECTRPNADVCPGKDAQRAANG